MIIAPIDSLSMKVTINNRAYLVVMPQMKYRRTRFPNAKVVVSEKLNLSVPDVAINGIAAESVK